MSKGKETNMITKTRILLRLRSGQGIRAISRELKVHRDVIREVKAIAQEKNWLSSLTPCPSDEEIAKVFHKPKKETINSLEAYDEKIKGWLKEEDMTITVIHKLIKENHLCSYSKVQRYLHKHFPKEVKPAMVREAIPGEVMDVDYGCLGNFLDDQGKPKRCWVFSARLRYSRIAYREIVFRQTKNIFLEGQIRAFEYFKGVPHEVVVDNLKAGVIQSTIDNDQLQKDYLKLAEHYKFKIDPCLPYTPQHKGGVENDMKYIKRNFLPYFKQKQKEKGITTPKYKDLVEELKRWNDEVADKRVIQGVGQSPLELFEVEKSHLQTLPNTRWEYIEWHIVKVHKEWRVVFDNVYYSVPYKYIDKQVSISVTSSMVRIFHENEEIACHQRLYKKWAYQRNPDHAPPYKDKVLHCSREGLLSEAERIGPYTYEFMKLLFETYSTTDKLRAARHLLNLEKTYPKERIEAACKRALYFKNLRYASVKRILEDNLDSEPLESSPANAQNDPSYQYQRSFEEYKQGLSTTRSAS